MYRVKFSPKTSSLEGKRIIVTGCWYKPINHTFYDKIDKQATHDEIFIGNSGVINGELQEMKANIGTAISAVLTRHGADVLMVWHTIEKLKNIKSALFEWLFSHHIDSAAVDLLDEQSVKKFVSKLPTDKPIYRVQSIWLWAGNYHLKNDNPYLPLEEMDVWLIEAEATTVLKGTHIMMKALLPVLKKQPESKIVIISSMSAIRWYALWSSHCPAKAAIDKYANVAMLKLYKDNIRVSTVRPGAVDTGMYDDQETRNAVRNISAEYNGVWKKDKDIVLMPPTAVGEMVKTILTSPAHIAEVNMLSKSQFPNQWS